MISIKVEVTGDAPYRCLDEHRFVQTSQISPFEGLKLLHTHVESGGQVTMAQAQLLSPFPDGSTDSCESGFLGSLLR